jgi:flagellar protein FlaG
MQIDTSSIPASGPHAKAAPELPPVQPSRVKQPTAQPADAEALQNAVKAARAAVRSLSNSLEFSVDQHSGRTVVRIYDAGTRQLIRQLPSEEMLAIARALDKLQGMLIRDQA